MADRPPSKKKIGRPKRDAPYGYKADGTPRKTAPGTGRPAHVPTPASRMLVRMLKIADTKPDGTHRTKEDIAHALGIESPKTFDKHYRTEWLTAKLEVDAVITHTMIEKAIGGLIELDAKGNMVFARNYKEADASLLRFIAERKMGWPPPRDPDEDTSNTVKVIITGGLPDKS
jgi:hypothetical protein